MQQQYHVLHGNSPDLETQIQMLTNPANHHAGCANLCNCWLWKSLLQLRYLTWDIRTSLTSQPTDTPCYSTKRVNLSLVSKMFTHLLSRSRHGNFDNFGSKLSLCDHDLFCLFVLHILGAAKHPLLQLATYETENDGAHSMELWKTKDPIHNNCVVHVNTQNSLQVSSSAPERIDTNIKCASCETNGMPCFSTSVEVHRSDHRCFPESVSPIHQAPLGFLEEEDLTTATLSSDPKRLPPETHLECPSTAIPNHHSQSFDTRAFDPAVTPLEIV